MNVALAYLEQHRDRLDLDRYGIPTRLSSLILTPRFQASRHVVFLLLAEGGRAPVLVAKIPRLLDTHGSLTREAASLQAVQGLRPSGFDSVPHLVAFESYCGRPMLIETALAGPMMEPAVVRQDPDRCCRLVLDWLVDLQGASTRDAGTAWFGSFVEGPLQRFAAAFPLTAGESALLDRTRALVEPLRTARLPFVCEHGDLSHPNLILTGDDTIGVVDWELAQTDGLPAYDLFVFLAYVAFSRHKAHTAAGHVAAFRSAFFEPDAWASRLAGAFARRANLPAEWLSPLFVLCWARYTITLLERLTEPDPAAPEAVPAAVPAATANWLRSNRYYRLWEESVANVSRLTWSV